VFTGIIETTGRLERARPARSGARLVVSTDRPLPKLRLGESIAINGCCLTVSAKNGRTFTADVSPETLRRTTLGALRPGAQLNLERSLRIGDRLGGHLVQGHVDGVGRLEKIRPVGAWREYVFTAPPPVARHLVEKGSIAVDGISLTSYATERGRFTVALIPETLKRTTLGRARPGDRVNLEADVIAKLVERYTRRRTR
jgi:riboflavin synthase